MVPVANQSQVPIQVSDIEILTDPADFAVDQECVGALPSQSPCKITLTFAPSTKGTKKGKLKIVDRAAGSPQIVNLAGTAF